MNIVGIETRYGLVDAGIEIRWGGGGDFAPSFWLVLGGHQPTVESVQGFVREVKQLGYGVEQFPASSAEDKEKVALYLLSIWAFMVWCRANTSAL